MRARYSTVVFSMASALTTWVAVPAAAEVIGLHAELTGDQAVPPANTAASGTLTATYDSETRLLTWSIEYAGLSGLGAGLVGYATAAHFHGPAEPGEVAAPVLPIVNERLTSPIQGTATLTEDQAADLMAGLWYFNIHTAVHPDGEIRGQVMLDQAAAAPVTPAAP
jgi:hypothetical protein